MYRSEAHSGENGSIIRAVPTIIQNFFATESHRRHEGRLLVVGKEDIETDECQTGVATMRIAFDHDR